MVKIAEDEYFQMFYKKIDSLGNVLEYNLAPTEVPISLGIAHTRTIMEDDFGNWIIAGLYFDDRSDACFNCYQHIPYIFSASPNFDTLLWQTRFYDEQNQNSTHYHLHSMTQVDDGYVVAADDLSSEGSSFPKGGVLFKASLLGDSLWMKHYIPLTWEEERVAWANFNDVKTTPDGNLVVAGAIGDLDLQIVRPWILHLDSGGCLVPDCNSVSTDNERFAVNEKKFLIYPNPAGQELYLLSTITSPGLIEVKIVTNEGIVIRSTNILIQSGNQYILRINELTPGTYHLVLGNGRKEILESHTFIKQ